MTRSPSLRRAVRALAHPLLLAPPLLAGLAGCEGQTTEPPPPAPAPPPVFVAVAAGGSHSCALADDGLLFCWGRGGTGALGIDTLSSVTRPAAVVSGGFRFQSVSAGTDHTCAATPAGEAYCWGVGDRGQLGTGRRADSRVPAVVLGGALFQRISAGREHTCAMSDSIPFCWGRGDHGELGTALIADTARPYRRIGYSHGYRAVSAGGHHACGITTLEQVRCWGWNRYGQLGAGHTIGLGLPEPVAGEQRFAQVSAGLEHTCALQADGRAFCWGRGDSGQLGTGQLADATRPTAVAGGHAFTAIGAGATHTCALLATGQAFCWGSNFDGQLGSGGPAQSEPAPVAVAGTLRFRQVSAGARHTCGVTPEGVVHCWGFGGFGQLGHGRTLTERQPVRVLDP